MSIDKINIKDLSSDEKIRYILDFQDQGLSIKQIAKKMGYSKRYGLTRFMSNNGYLENDDKFFKNKADKTPTNDGQQLRQSVNIKIDKSDKEVTIGRQQDPKDQEDTTPTNSLQLINNQEIQTKLLDIVNNYDSFIEGINWINEFKRQQADNCQTVIEVNTGLQLDFNKSETVKATIRVDQDIWKDFSDLCKDERYKHFNKQDLISKAFADFINQYK